MTYAVAKANPTAYAFVVKSTNLKPGWIIIHPEIDSYAFACQLRDAHNS